MFTSYRQKLASFKRFSGIQRNFEIGFRCLVLLEKMEKEFSEPLSSRCQISNFRWNLISLSYSCGFRGGSEKNTEIVAGSLSRGFATRVTRLRRARVTQRWACSQARSTTPSLPQSLRGQSLSERPSFHFLGFSCATASPGWLSWAGDSEIHYQRHLSIAQTDPTRSREGALTFSCTIFDRKDKPFIYIFDGKLYLLHIQTEGILHHFYSFYT